MRILCYGDSDTYGHDPRSPLGKPYPPDVRWTDRLARATGWEGLNAGLNGREIPHLPGELRDAEALFAAASPFDQAVVFLGSNDMMQGLSAQEVAARMEAFLGRLTAYPLLADTGSHGLRHLGDGGTAGNGVRQAGGLLQGAGPAAGHSLRESRRLGH